MTIHGQPSRGWQATAPDEEGQWWMLCDEVDGQPELVDAKAIRGVLHAISGLIFQVTSGRDWPVRTVPIAEYHSSVTNGRWQKAIGKAPEMFVNAHGHRLSYCPCCDCDTVICGACGNNSCNGGYGEVGGEQCKACPSAYDLASAHYKRLMWEQQSLEEWVAI